MSEQLLDSFTCFQINVMMEVDPPEERDPEACVKEEDDPIVKEVPVFLSKSVNCYMFQYPVRPASMTYDDSAVMKARFRPNNQQVQLEMRLNTQSENYDKSKGEQIALNTDGSGGNATEGNYFQSRMMDKQMLMGQSVETMGESGGQQVRCGKDGQWQAASHRGQGRAPAPAQPGLHGQVRQDRPGRGQTEGH